MNKEEIKTLGALRKSDYRSRSVKDELRDNLLDKLQRGEQWYEGIIGYGDTVIPQLETAILARHNINFLGLRGQAKTRMARMLIRLLDEYIPVITGSDINDDPLNPISYYGKELVAREGDDTPVSWLHRTFRYTEKLATPDVTVADLIGDLDPIKAASMKLSYSDERAIHFGLVPRAHRGIFVINELPDLQARIQVALFNVLQEKDLQVRGFNLRLPVDVAFIFTANPEDYTNRGSIVTPLKDRVQSQIVTHYPADIQISLAITEQEAQLTDNQRKKVHVPAFVEWLIEQVGFEARESDYVDQKSGVSARLGIALREALVSAAERRMVCNGESETFTRIADLYQCLPAINGKIELVYEGEQEGAEAVSMHLISKAIRSAAARFFKRLEAGKRQQEEPGHYDAILKFFADGGKTEIRSQASEKKYRETLDAVSGLKKVVEKQVKPAAEESYVWMEFLLHALAGYNRIGVGALEKGTRFQDVMGDFFRIDPEAGEGDVRFGLN